MNRRTIFALLLVPFLIAAASAQTSPPAVPIIHFSFYAPPQKDPPVHIVNFENNKSETQFALSNTSDKSVTGVIINSVYAAPSGCALEAQRDDMAFMGVNGAGYELRIGPHEKAVASRIGIFRVDQMPPQTASYPRLTGVTPQGAVPAGYPRSVVFTARDAKAGYMQVQFAVIGVFFEDGSTWPAQISDGEHQYHFDPKLVEADAGKCADVANVANALQSVEEVVFERETASASDKSDDESVPPLLRFSCSLEGVKAVCRLPRETNHHASPAQPEKVR
jgi:hypothetical protein